MKPAAGTCPAPKASRGCQPPKPAHAPKAAAAPKKTAHGSGEKDRTGKGRGQTAGSRQGERETDQEEIVADTARARSAVGSASTNGSDGASTSPARARS